MLILDFRMCNLKSSFQVLFVNTTTTLTELQVDLIFEGV